jgi:hypothetical protein
MRYRKSYINVVGKGWYNQTIATTYNVTDHDTENMRDEDDNITRESVELWLDSHSGDFQHVEDFSASISLSDGADIEIEWRDEDNEMAFNDCMYLEID